MGGLVKHEKKKASCWASKIMFADEQGFRCAICRKDNNVDAMDHCHKTGWTRGTLCKSCNVAIGLLREDAEIFRRAVLYLHWSQLRIAWLEGEGEYVPIWPIFVGDFSEKDYPEAYLMADKHGQQIDFAYFQYAIAGKVSSDEMQKAIRARNHELAQKKAKSDKRKRYLEDLERRKRRSRRRPR